MTPKRDEADGLIAAPTTAGYDASFYDAWAAKQLHDPQREFVLEWKAIHLANLFRTNLPDERPRSICEIGGAEGTVLSVVGRLLGAAELVNHEPSKPFCDAGRARHPQITFLQSLFAESPRRFDVVVLSDILEHVPDDAGLLSQAAECSRFVLIKMPVEKAFSVSPAGYLARGSARPREMVFGPGHYNGHLRGYTVRSALESVRARLPLIDWYAVDHSFYYRGSALFALLRRWLGLAPLMRIFGGSLFVLARGRC